MSMMRRRLLDDTVRRTAEGEAMAVRSVARMRPGLSIYGKGHQNTVAGNQLLNPELFNADRVNGGITFTNNHNGSVSVSGTATANPSWYLGNYINVLEDGETYGVSVDSSIVIISITIIFSDGRREYSKTITVDKSTMTSIVPYLQVTNGRTVNETVYPMLNKGSTALPYEPYTGGQPSPNPDYPQEIEITGKDGEIGVDVYGGNLLSAVNEADSDLTTNGVTITNNGDGSFTVTGAPTVTEGIIFTYYVTREMALEDGKYILSSGIFCIIHKKDGARDYVVNNFAFDSEVDESVYIYWQRSIDNYVDGETIWPMLNIGSTALPFEPYKQPQSLTVSTPNGLPGIPVSSGGNYTDENGQQWISDEIDFKRGKYVKRVIKYSGPYSVVKWTGNLYFLIAKKLENAPKSEYMGFCNVSGSYIRTWENMGHSHWFLQPKNQQIVIHLGDKYNTEEAVRQFMDENEIVVYYVAETPIETDLTPEQITAYQSLHTNYPTTTVMNDSDAGMKLTYKTRKSLEVT